MKASVSSQSVAPGRFSKRNTAIGMASPPSSNETQGLQQQPYKPPDSLPPPLAQSHGTPILPILFGLGGALALGVTLFAASRFIYVYIVFNVLLGLGIGIAMSIGIRLSRYTGEGVLFGLTILYSLLCYVVFNYVLYHWVLLVGVPYFSPSFLQFLQIRAEQTTLIWGINPGTTGNMIPWIVEAVITLLFAVKIVAKAVRECHIESVPPAVLEFVFRLAFQGHDRPAMERELEKRGWSRPEERQQAILAARSAAAVLQESQQVETEIEKRMKALQMESGGYIS
jgi:hypothetical protein